MAAKFDINTSGPGRPRESEGKRGTGYKLAEYLDKHWDKKVRMSNGEVAIKLGFKSPNIVSMWRMGKVKVALERLPELATLMNVDLAVLLPLWFDQQLGETGAMRSQSEARLKSIQQTLDRTVTLSESAIIRTLRDFYDGDVPALTSEQLDAIVAIAHDETLADTIKRPAKPVVKEDAAEAA